MDQRHDNQSTADIEQTLDAIEASVGELQAANAHEPDVTQDQLSNGFAGNTTRQQPGTFVGYQTELAEQADRIDAATAGTGLTSPTPTPPPKRPKGRLLIGGFLFALLMAGLYIVWDGVFRYGAYGVVEAKHVAVPAPTTGIIQRVCVAEGDAVRAGDTLVVIHDVRLEHELERTREQLRLAEAQLDAHVSDLRRDALKRAVLQKWDIHDNAAELFELASSLQQHRAEAERLERDLVRKQALRQSETATQEQLERVLFALQGEQRLIEQLDRAVSELKERQAIIPPEESVDFSQMKPALVQIENLQLETQRLIEQLQESRIVAPVSGTIVRHSSLVGCRVIPDQLLMAIIQEGTTEPVVYFSQSDTQKLNPGDELAVHIHPHSESLECRISHVGEEFMPAPSSIERYYGKHEPLLPVKLTPPPGIALRPGATVRLPHSF